VTPPTSVFTILDTTGREWADGPTLRDAVFGAELISHEEQREMIVQNPHGEEVAWCYPDQPTFTLQGAQR
jgi:hypothetical protein